MSPTEALSPESADLSIEKFLNINKDPDWLKEKRINAWKKYLNESLPDRVKHLWRYSDPVDFEINNREINHERISLTFSQEEELAKNNIIFSELSPELLSNNDNLGKSLGKLTSEKPYRITFLNDVLWSGGYCLYVPSGVKLDKPLVVQCSQFQKNKYHALRMLIILEEGAEISLIDEIGSGSSEKIFSNVLMEVFLSKKSKLHYVNIQTLDKDATHHFCQKAVLGERSELSNLIVALGGKMSKADLSTQLSGHGSIVSTYGIVLGDSIQKFDHHTSIEHIAPETKSSLDFRVVLKDKARSAYTGNLKINNEAAKSDAHQENRNLLLSDNAKAESMPELEILTNDVVRCNHGVTVGQVDKEQIYYLMSRGLKQKDAEKLIVEGFLEPTIFKIPQDSLREKIVEEIHSKLENI